MAHLTNFNRKAIHGVLEHNGRAPEDDVERKNENIDPERTPLNYAVRHDGLIVGSDKLKETRAALRKAIYKEIKRTDKKRRAAGRPKLRKDAAVMSSWVVPLPADWPDGVDEQVFFKCVMAFILKRYEHGVSFGFVHMDETHPHMHVILIPFDKDKCISKKDVFTRADLRTFHDDFQKYMDEQLDFHATVRLDEDDLVGRAKSKMDEEEKKALDADTEATIEDRVEAEVYAERVEMRSKASELKKWEEDLARDDEAVETGLEALAARQEELDEQEGLIRRIYRKVKALVDELKEGVDKQRLEEISDEKDKLVEQVQSFSSSVTVDYDESYESWLEDEYSEDEDTFAP
jgi:hypothetical protein